MNANIEALVAKHFNPYAIYGTEHLDAIRNALTEQAEAFKGELQAYDGTVRELTKTVEDMQAAQAVPVVGEPTDAAYKWMIANGVEPLTSLHKLGERLAAFLDEDQFSGCETLLLTAITAINTFVPVPAAELASLREKAAEADELGKDAEIAVTSIYIALDALNEIIEMDGQDNLGDAKREATKAMAQLAAIAQGKGE